MKSSRGTLKRNCPRLTAIALSCALAYPHGVWAQSNPANDVSGPKQDVRYQGLTPVEVNPGLSNLPDRSPHAIDGPNAQVDRIRVDVDRDAIPADGQTPVGVTVHLYGADGNPLAVSATITIEAQGARIRLPGRATDELGPARGDLDRVVPGVQLRVDKGVGTFELIAPDVPTDVRLSVTVGGQQAQGSVSFVPELRPMLATGLVEGVVSVDKTVNSGVSNSLFENELNHTSGTFENGRGQYGGRTEFFVKGVIRGDYLLTMAYDSDKASESPLFRDIRPEEFYPVYGDASVKGFDGQTTQKLYVRIDKDHSFVMYGDFNTLAPTQSPASLGNYSRTLTGLNSHFESSRVTGNAFASRGSAVQVVEEQPARGTSGPYFVTNLNGIRNSEKVEIITRDRNQPSVILLVQEMTRFVDYTFEPFSGQVLFTQPVPTLDSNFNPNTIRITYEVDNGGPNYWVSGVNGQVKVTDNATVGGSAVDDQNPLARYRLESVNGAIKLSENTSLSAEVAHSFRDRSLDTTLLATDTPIQSGNGERVEFKHADDNWQVLVNAGKTDLGFYNATSTLQTGRTEIDAATSYKLTSDLKLAADLSRSEDAASGAERNSGQVYGDYKINDTFSVQAGIRRSDDKAGELNGQAVAVNAFAAGITNISSGQNATPFQTNSPQLQNAPDLADSTSLRLRLTAKLGEKSSAYGEYERDVVDAAKERYALGADYQLFEKTRLYARHEWSSSSSGPDGLIDGGGRDVLTTIGVDTAYMKDGQIFSEYRLRDSEEERDAQAAFGVRNLWNLADGIRVTASFERQNTSSSSTSGSATALPTSTASTTTTTTTTSSSTTPVASTSSAITGAPTVTGAPQIGTIASPFAQVGGATALTGGIELTYDPTWKAAARLELRQDDNYNGVLSTLAYSTKMNRDWTFIARNYLDYLNARNDTVANEYEDRFQVGAAFRPVDNNRWNALGRYELRISENLTAPDPAKETAHIFSVQGTYHPSRPWWFSGRVASEWVFDDFDGVHSNYFAHLVGARLMYDISENWDIGLTSDILFSPQGQARQYAAGFEVGYLLKSNLWLSGGYNWTGFSNRDLTGTDYTNRGAYIRLRYKFDEDAFSGDDPDRNPVLDRNAVKSP